MQEPNVPFVILKTTHQAASLMHNAGGTDTTAIVNPPSQSGVVAISNFTIAKPAKQFRQWLLRSFCDQLFERTCVSHDSTSTSTGRAGSESSTLAVSTV